MFEPNSNKPLALISRGQLYFYQLDQLGTPLSLTDSDNNIVWQAHYSVFGKATLTVNKVDNPIRFQGQYFDAESGLHYNHFRYYDPEIGRFISQDPIGLLGGINHYQYAPNHINWIDPLGLCAKEEGDTKYKTTPLLPEFVGEDDPNNEYRWNKMFGCDSVCQYLNENQRSTFEVVVENGLLVYGAGTQKGHLVDTRNMSSLHSDKPSAIFVMNEHGKIYLGSHGEPGSFHHSSFLAGERVASAGEIVVKDGKIEEISNLSGHYRPNQSLNNQVFAELESKGMNKSDVSNITRSGINDFGNEMAPKLQKDFEKADNWQPGDEIPYDWSDF